MPFILKIHALLHASEGEQIEINERAYYGGDAIAAGDEAFIWFSGSVQRLAWFGEVIRVALSTDNRIPVTVRLIARAGANALGNGELMPLRNVRDGSALASLSNKLYRHSLNKVAQLEPDEAALLREYF